MRIPTLLAITLLAVGCDTGSTNPFPASQLGRRLAVGERTVCAITTAGGTLCWGANTNQIEYGATIAPANKPVSVSNGVTILGLSRGASQFMCGVITTAHGGACWGRGGVGQMGTGTDGLTGNIATVMNSPIRWSAFSTGRLLACGLDEGGVVYCWGLNQRGETGSPSTALGAHVTTPTAINSTATFLKVSAGWLHACGITTSRDLYCWGTNVDGQLGIGATDTLTHPQPTLIGSGKWIDVTTGSRSTCAIAAADSTAWCWGFNYTGQLGDGTTTSRAAPTRVSTTDKFIAIEMSSGFGAGFAGPSGTPQAPFSHTCGLRSDSTAVCWGWNSRGQLGDGTTTDRLTPVAVLGGEKFALLGAGGASTCGMKGEYIWCWGANTDGQLGNGTYDDSPAPVKVSSPFSKP